MRDAAIMRGYRRATAAERSAFGTLSSFSAAIFAARAINYIPERRRRAPALRDRVRRTYHAPGREKLRVHHFLPGMALVFAVGLAAIMKRDDGLDFWLGLPFGTGAGLTLDEIAVLTERDNPYWESGRLALAQAGIAALGATGLAVRFNRLGERGLAHPSRISTG